MTGKYPADRIEAADVAYSHLETAECMAHDSAAQAFYLTANQWGKSPIGAALDAALTALEVLRETEPENLTGARRRLYNAQVEYVHECATLNTRTVEQVIADLRNVETECPDCGGDGIVPAIGRGAYVPCATCADH